MVPLGHFEIQVLLTLKNPGLQEAQKTSLLEKHAWQLVTATKHLVNLYRGLLYAVKRHAPLIQLYCCAQS